MTGIVSQRVDPAGTTPDDVRVDVGGDTPRLMVGSTADPGRSLETFVWEHYPRLIRLSALICRNTADAEDAVQAALLRAWRRGRTLDAQASLRPWLDKIVVRETLRLVSARRPVDELYVVDAVQQAPPTSDIAVRIALERLTPPQRAAVVLHLYVGHTVPETAAIFGIAEETVRSRLRVGRQLLRRVLGEESQR